MDEAGRYISPDKERRRITQECREKMSVHIRERLDIVIAPKDVRLRPEPGELYAWRVVPNQNRIKPDILTKQLSRLSIGPLRILLRSIGTHLEAIASPSIVSPHVVPSQTDVIQDPYVGTLEDENVRLKSDIVQLKSEVIKLRSDYLECQSQKRQLEENLRMSEGYHEMQEQDLGELVITASMLANRIQEHISQSKSKSCLEASVNRTGANAAIQGILEL